ncbi:MAG: hypothetical protein C4316_10260 [Chloroflexota bacterium]
MEPGEFKLFNLSQAERDRLTVMLASFFRGRQEVELAFLFGPFAAGRPFRWVDVGVTWTPEVANPWRAAGLLERALARTYGLRWQVRDLEAVGPIRAWEASGGPLIHAADPDRAVGICRRSWPAAWDFLPKLRRWFGAGS